MAKPARKSRDLLIVFFYIFIAVLILFFVVVTLKIAFSPVCSADAQHVCVIDTWSIAGLTAAVFGIAAALLTFLGAFAVAYWWANLDKRVTYQVNHLYKRQEEQVNQLVKELLEKQTTKVDTQLQQFQGDFQTLRERLETLRNEQKALETWINTVVELQFAAILLNPPEDIEEIATKAVDLLHAPTIAAQMVFKYLESVDGRFMYGLSIDDGNGKPVPNLLFFWEKSLHWQKVLEKFYPPGRNIEEVTVGDNGEVSFQTPEIVKQVQEKIDEYKPRVEEWKKLHGG